MIAKGLLGKEIRFTRGAIGDGSFDYETERVFDLTEMRGEKMTLPIESVKKTGDGTVTITVHRTNAEVYDGFCAREHAIFAQDPDTGEEFLYAYRNVGSEYTYIPANTSTAKKDIRFAYVTVVKDADNITATLDLSFHYATNEEFTEHINAAHPHPNIPNHYLDIEEASELWAADNDSHLHKISIDKLKQQLQCNSDTTLMQPDAADLGLDANILLFDDDGSLTDKLKVKVTSSAENGQLIGVESVEGLRQGAVYTISDGINQEQVRLASVRYNLSGYHCRLSEGLLNAYDWDATYLYRTTAAGAEKLQLSWTPEPFNGVEANIPRTLTLKMSGEMHGDGFVDGDYLTLG